MVTLNRPERLNAIDSVMCRELIQLFLLLTEEEDVRAVLLEAAGPTFCVGWDRGEGGADCPSEESTSCLQELNRLTELLLGMPKPVVCAVRGIAAGVGLGLVLACDAALGSADARFALPLSETDGTPDAGAARLLALAVGSSEAEALTRTGEMISAEAAVALGILEGVVPAIRLEDAAFETAKAYTSNPAYTFAGALR